MKIEAVQGYWVLLMGYPNCASKYFFFLYGHLFLCAPQLGTTEWHTQKLLHFCMKKQTNTYLINLALQFPAYVIMYMYCICSSPKFRFLPIAPWHQNQLRLEKVGNARLLKSCSINQNQLCYHEFRNEKKVVAKP